VSILVDALRGTRETPEPSCASLLAPLINEFGADRVDVRMYHTPNLTGIRKRLIPKRINEGWGLQHMKLYAFDDEIMLSGANLSADYFTNRQDRYYLFKSKNVTDYFSKLHYAIGDLSYQVEPSKTEQGVYTLQWPASNKSVQPLDDPTGYIKTATERIQPLLRAKIGSKTAALTSTDTAIYPLSQFTPLLTFDSSTELPALRRLLRIFLGTKEAPPASPSQWTFTAGYFNVHPALSNILTRTPSPGTVITAAAQANGFYGSAGVSGLLPAAYILLSRRFLEAAKRAETLTNLTLREWRRGTVGEKDGWTYHAKGIWVTLPNETDPSITLIGSSNYTQRSYKLDLESNALVVTKNAELKQRLSAETEHLLQDTKQITLEEFGSHERRVGIQVRLAMLAVKLLGGAL
jgi:CDP-diacylglycerol--glycerol-3-phosphate 3-phosphatidyltransferase